MKAIIVAVAFMLALSANIGTTFAEDDEGRGYEQHESRDHADRDKDEHGDRDNDRGERHAVDRNDAGGHRHAETESASRFWDWLPF